MINHVTDNINDGGGVDECDVTCYVRVRRAGDVVGTR